MPRKTTKKAPAMLKELKAMGYRQLEIAEAIGVSQTYVSLIANYREPSSEALGNLKAFYEECKNGR